MPYASNGSLTTDVREIAVSETWDSQSDWEAYQSASNVEITSGVIQLSETTVIDNFEDSPDGPYASGEDLSTYYGGTLSAFSRVTSGQIQEGTYSMQATARESISSTSGLPRYPAQGESFDGWIYSLADDPGILFATQSETAAPDSYLVRYNFPNDELQIYIIESGSFTQLQASAFTVEGNQWLRYEVEWYTDGTITARLYDDTGSELGSVTTTDTTYTSGGFGYRGGNNGDAYYDAFMITGSV